DVPGYPFERCRHWAEPAARVVQADSARPTSPRATEPEAAPEASAKTSQDLAADVAQFLVRTLQLPESERDSDRSFLEMGVDSLALTEAVAALERKWSIAIPRRALFETLGTP